MSVWLGGMVKDRITYPALCNLMGNLKAGIDSIRQSAIPDGIEALIVGDDSLGLPAAGRTVFPESRFQICLWHLCRDIMRQVKGLNWIQRQHLYHDFWEVFNALTLDECYERYLIFLRK
jgi:transposase-like protein